MLCPRCRVTLVNREVGDFAVVACKECSGLFIPHDTFSSMRESSTRTVEATTRSPQPNLTDTVAYVQCPVCAKMMNRTNFAGTSGVIIDVCGHHGFWFDADELEHIMTFISRGGLNKAKAEELATLKMENKFKEYHDANRRVEGIPTGGGGRGWGAETGWGDDGWGGGFLDSPDFWVSCLSFVLRMLFRVPF